MKNGVLQFETHVADAPKPGTGRLLPERAGDNQFHVGARAESLLNHQVLLTAGLLRD